jgi:hypothetical protein
MQKDFEMKVVERRGEKEKDREIGLRFSVTDTEPLY